MKFIMILTDQTTGKTLEATMYERPAFWLTEAASNNTLELTFAKEDVVRSPL